MQSWQVTFVNDETKNAEERESKIEIVVADNARDAIDKVADALHEEWRFSRTESGLTVMRQDPSEGHGCYTARRCYTTRLYHANGKDEAGEVLFDIDDFEPYANTCLEGDERVDLYDGKRCIARYACEHKRRVFPVQVG